MTNTSSEYIMALIRIFNVEQECIPVGCVPTAAVAAGGRGRPFPGCRPRWEGVYPTPLDADSPLGRPPRCRFPRGRTPPTCGQNDWQTLLKTLLSLAVGNESLTSNKVVDNFIILQQHKNSVPENFTSQKKKQWGSMHHGQRLHGTPVNIQTDKNENIIFPPLFSNYMLDISSGIESLGELRWQLALCLLLCWIIVFICLSTGVKSLGKVRCNRPVKDPGFIVGSVNHHKGS